MIDCALGSGSLVRDAAKHFVRPPGGIGFLNPARDAGRRRQAATSAGRREQTLRAIATGRRRPLGTPPAAAELAVIEWIVISVGG
jgi:hypothetical protein